MEVVKITAKMSSAIVMHSPLHLDAVLMGCHPALHTDYKPTRTDTDRGNLKNIPLPLASAYCFSTWVWGCTALEFPSDAVISTITQTKRTDPIDILYLQRQHSPGSGPMKDRMMTGTTVLTPEAYFYAVIKDEKELMRLLSRVKQIGGWRKNGNGAVVDWTIDKIEAEFRSVLIDNGKARRRIPDAFCFNKSNNKLQMHPPYWMSAGRQYGFEVGDEINLTVGIGFR